MEKVSTAVMGQAMVELVGLCHLTVRPWRPWNDRDHGRECWWAHTQQVLREQPLKDGRSSLRRAERWEAGHGQFRASPPALLWWVSWPEQIPPFLGQPHP